jgi:hypothetical protein
VKIVAARGPRLEAIEQHRPFDVLEDANETVTAERARDLA